MFFAQCLSDFSVSYGLPFSLFLAGLVGGFTHCIGMCSPFVLAQSSAMEQGHTQAKPKRFQAMRFVGALLLPYHLGRMMTYVFLAVLVSSVLNLAFIASDLRVLVSAPLLMLAGVLFLVTAFPALGALFPWAVKLQVVKPIKGIMGFARRLMGKQGVGHRFLLGVLLGFMPCGMVVSALLAAGSAPSAWQSGAAMAAFAAGTMPALMVLGLGGQGITYKYPQLSKRLSQGAMIMSACWLFVLAGVMVWG